VSAQALGQQVADAGGCSDAAVVAVTCFGDASAGVVESPLIHAVSHQSGMRPAYRRREASSTRTMLVEIEAIARFGG